MKELLLAIIGLVILVNNVNAEFPTDKGVYSLSGSISYNKLEHGDDRIISATPSFMYFVSPGFAMGLSIRFQNYKATIDESYSYGIGPIIRYYFGREPAYPFISLDYLYTYNKQEHPAISRTEENDLSIGLGFDYFLSKNVALEPLISYRFNSATYDMSFNTKARTEDLLISLGVNVFIY